ALCSRFGLEPAAMMTLIKALLDTMRLDKAVTMPEGVRVNDEVFGLSTATIYYQLTRPSTETKGPYVKDWVSPKDQYAQRQTRFDYARRILTSIVEPAESTEIDDTLSLVC